MQFRNLKRSIYILLSYLLAASQFSGCAHGAPTPKINTDLIAGSWAEGGIARGEGYYLEEDFLPGGRYCSIYLNPEGGDFDQKAGNWFVENGVLHVYVEKSLMGQIDAADEIRRLITVSKSTLVFDFRGSVVLQFKRDRLTREPDDRWCSFKS